MSDAATVENVALDVMGLGEAFAAVAESLSPAQFHARETDEAWSVAEIVGHASEFSVTFASKALELAGASGLAFGRRAERLADADLDECHGHTREVTWDGKRVTIYHYHATPEFPYTVGCFRSTAIRTRPQ